MDSSTLVIAGNSCFKLSHYEQAKELYELAAKENNGEAFFRLGNMYLHGYGVEQDKGKAK